MASNPILRSSNSSKHHYQTLSINRRDSGLGQKCRPPPRRPYRSKQHKIQRIAQKHAGEVFGILESWMAMRERLEYKEWFRLEKKIKQWTRTCCVNEFKDWKLSLTISKDDELCELVWSWLKIANKDQECEKEFEDAIRRLHLVAQRHHENSYRNVKSIISNVLLANYYFSTKEIQECLNHFGCAQNSDPEFALIYLNRGVVKEIRGDMIRAFEDYTFAIEVAPDLAYAYLNRGNISLQLNDPENAITDFNTVIALSDVNSETKAIALVNRGNVYMNMNQFDKARNDYDLAIQFNPKYPHAYLNRGLLSATVFGDWYSAIEDYCKVLEIDHNNVFAFEYRAIANQNLLRFEESIADYSRALEIDPNSPSRSRWLSDRAYILQQQNRFDKEKQGLKALPMVVDNPTSTFNLVNPILLH